MRGHDAVVHFAAESHVDRSIAGPDDFINTNCFGTNIVMDTARRLEISRVVHIGTDEVYGSVEVGSSTENDALEPRSPYSASKAGSDLIALSYHHTYGLPVVVTRCTNNFGPYQYPEKVIPLFTTNLLDGTPVPLYGDGLNERDWIYVDDHCAGVHLALREGAAGEIYNIGAGNETPNRVLVDKLLALLERGEDLVEYVTDRLGHDRRYSVDIAKITALGWTRKRSLDEALAETVEWYRANRWWWEPLKVRRGMRVLVTGAGGQVGTRARRRARTARGHRVHARRSRRRRPRRGAGCDHRHPARCDRPLRGVDQRRRVRIRHRPRLPRQRARLPQRHGSGAARRRLRGRAVDRLRVRRREGDAVRRVGHAQPDLGLRRVEARGRVRDRPELRGRAGVVGMRPQRIERGRRRSCGWRSRRGTCASSPISAARPRSSPISWSRCARSSSSGSPAPGT